MQMQLPIFPNTTKLINPSVGIYEKDDLVYYLHNGSPIHCHNKNDLNSYRYVTAQIVVNGLCSPVEIAKAVGVSSRNIQRYVKALREKGANWFFNREENRGRAHKITDDVLNNAQRMIDDFYSVADVARLLGVTEGALRYHIKKGNIKKKMETIKVIKVT